MEYDLHMISHAYVTYLKLKNNGRDPRKARSAAFGKSRRLVRASVKRLLPKQRPPTLSAEQENNNKKAEIPKEDKIEVKVSKNKKKNQTSKKPQPSTSSSSTSTASSSTSTAFVSNGHQKPLTLK